MDWSECGFLFAGFGKKMALLTQRAQEERVLVLSIPNREDRNEGTPTQGVLCAEEELLEDCPPEEDILLDGGIREPRGCGEMAWVFNVSLDRRQKPPMQKVGLDKKMPKPKTPKRQEERLPCARVSLKW